MYTIIFISDSVAHYRGWNRAVAECSRFKSVSSLAEAQAARVVAGDLVVDATNRIVQDDAWLWPWEIEAREQSYAWRMIHRFPYAT